jgi:hypothetical protein
MATFSVDVRHRLRLDRVLVCDTKDLIAKLGGGWVRLPPLTTEKTRPSKIFIFIKRLPINDCHGDETNVYFPTIPERAVFANWLQAKRDQILWILSENGGKMERSKLRVRAGMRYALLDPILDKLKMEGRIRTTGDLVSLNR